MDTNFKHLLGDATRLTRKGDLVAATRAIREALGVGREGSGESLDPTRGERDGAARTRPAGERAHREASSEAVPRERRSGEHASVIDGEWRTIDAKETNGANETVDAQETVGAREAVGAKVNGAGRSDRGGDGVVTRGRHVGRSRALDYRLFVPPLAAGAPPPALVVMLHGCTQDADDFARGTAMDALAREHGFLVLYPEQNGRAHPQRCWNWFKHTHQRRGQGEAGLIEALVREIVAEHGVDAERVFVAGLSAGGAMAAILGDVCPELFRAVGVHSGLAAGSATDLPGALAAMRGGQGEGRYGGRSGADRGRSSVDGDDAAKRLPPTIVFHGDADRTVHPENGERVVAACLAPSRHAPDAAPEVERREGRDGERRWSSEVYRDARGTVLVEHWCVRGAAHAWSGGDPRGSWTDASGPDASAEMVRFFLAAGER